MTTKLVNPVAHVDPSNPRELNGPKAKGLRRTLRQFRLILQPIAYMDDNVRHYGPMFKIGGESRPLLVYVGDPDIVREVFLLDPTMVEVGPRNLVLKWWGNSLVCCSMATFTSGNANY